MSAQGTVEDWTELFKIAETWQQAKDYYEHATSYKWTFEEHYKLGKAFCDVGAGLAANYWYREGGREARAQEYEKQAALAKEKTLSRLGTYAEKVSNMLTQKKAYFAK